MEDKIKRSQKTDASLYNGQPSDTGSMCRCDGNNTFTPPTFEDKNGVSVSCVPTSRFKWFVLRVSYGRVLKASEILTKRNIENYVPMKYKEITKQGKKQLVKEPILPSLIFVHSTLEILDSVLNDGRVNHEDRSLLSYYYDHTIQRKDAPDRNPPLIVRDDAMMNFIKLTSIKNPHIIQITSKNIQYKLGDEVIVTEGEFNGIRGRVARIAGQQRVVIELFGGCLIATAYVPKDAMRKYQQP